MSPTVDGVPAHEALGSAYDHGALSSKSLLCTTALGFKQALTSLNLAPTDLWSGWISIQENATLDDQDSTMIIKEDFLTLFENIQLALLWQDHPMLVQW